MSQALRQLAQLKVKDVPNFAKENVTTSNISNSFQKWAHNYHQKYILTGSIKPLNDLLIYVGILSYAVGILGMRKKPPSMEANITKLGLSKHET
eukprot:jgi/Mesen1/3197/ME000185S02338